MAKSKGNRASINLKCTICSNSKLSKPVPLSIQSNLSLSIPKRKSSMNIYRTTKSRQNNKERLELKKFCRICNTHRIYIESK